MPINLTIQIKWKNVLKKVDQSDIRRNEMSTSPLSIRYIDQEIKNRSIKKVSGPNDYTSEFCKT